MLKAILFDLDGTLIDSEEYYTNGTKEWLNNRGIYPSEKELFGIIGLNMPDTYEYLHKLSNLSINEVKDENDRYFNSHKLDFKKYLFQDVIETLKKLKEKGIKIMICSLSPKNYIEEFISECNLEAYIDDYIGGDECTHDKPHPEIYLKALAKLGINANEAIVIEDSFSGIKAGKDAGIYTMARNGAKYHLDQKEADEIFDDLREITKKWVMLLKLKEIKN